MPISKFAIEAYLNRNGETKTWFKKLLSEEVEEELSHIQPPPKFTIKSFRLDQKICFLMGIAYPETLFMTDVGWGKTGISLELLSYFYDNGFIRKAFVFTPTNEISEGWGDEIKKWGFRIPYLILGGGSSANKWRSFPSLPSGIIIGTYAGIAA